MSKYLFILPLFLFFTALNAQFRMVGSGTWFVVNDSTYTATVTFEADLTGMGYLANQIQVGFRVFTPTEQVYTVSVVADLTFSSATLTIIEYQGDHGSPVGQVTVYDPGDRKTIPQLPFGNTGATAQMNNAISSYNARRIISRVVSRNDSLFVVTGEDELYVSPTSISGVQDTSTLIVYAPAHGLTDSIALYGYVPVKADYSRANSLSRDSSHVFYAIDAPHVDTLEIKVSGLIEYASWHGKQIGALYLLQDDGTEDTIQGTVSAPTIVTLDSLRLILSEVGSETGQVIARQPIPSPVIVSLGGDPLNPTDTIVQRAVSEIFKPAGLAKPGTVFFTSYSSQSSNPTYQEDSPSGSPLSPGHSWLWDGQVVTRLSYLLSAIDLQATSIGLFALDTVKLSSGIPTDVTVAAWLDSNYTKNNLRLPNGAKLYWVGAGTKQSPDYMWEVIDDPANTTEPDNWLRILKRVSVSSTWLKPELEAGNDVTIDATGLSPDLYIGEPGLVHIGENFTLGHVELKLDPAGREAEFGMTNFDGGIAEGYVRFFDSEDYAEGEIYATSNAGRADIQFLSFVGGLPSIKLEAGLGETDFSSAFAMLDTVIIVGGFDNSIQFRYELPRVTPDTNQTMLWVQGEKEPVFTYFPTSGNISNTTDGSGDITVTHGLPDATFSSTVTATGTTAVLTTVHTKTATTFKVRFYSATTGSALTATPVTADWIAKDIP